MKIIKTGGIEKTGFIDTDSGFIGNGTECLIDGIGEG